MELSSIYFTNFLWMQDPFSLCLAVITGRIATHLMHSFEVRIHEFPLAVQPLILYPKRSATHAFDCWVGPS